MASVNNQTAKRSKAQASGVEEDATEYPNAVSKKLPFPETYTNKQGSTNGDMIMAPKCYEKNRDFATEEFTTDNKNPNNESYAKTKNPKGATSLGLGEIGRLANSDKWGNTGKS